jgi:hypothetical protein
VVPQSTRLKVIDNTISSSFLKNKSFEINGESMGVKSSSTTKLVGVPSDNL